MGKPENNLYLAHLHLKAWLLGQQEEEGEMRRRKRTQWTEEGKSKGKDFKEPRS